MPIRLNGTTEIVYSVYGRSSSRSASSVWLSVYMSVPSSSV